MKSATCYDCGVTNTRVFPCQALFNSLQQFKAIVSLNRHKKSILYGHTWVCAVRKLSHLIQTRKAHFVRAYVDMCREIVVTFNTNQ